MAAPRHHWIKIRAGLIDDPEVARLSDSFDDYDLGNLDPLVRRSFLRNTVLGSLSVLWLFVNAKAENDAIAGMRLEDIDFVVGISGFGAALAEQRWVVVTEEGLTFPNFDRHNCVTSSRHNGSTSAERMRRKRAKDKALQDSPKKCDGSDTKTPLSLSPPVSDGEEVQEEGWQQSPRIVLAEGARKWQHFASRVINAYPSHRVGPRGKAVDAACALCERISQSNSSLTVDESVDRAVHRVAAFRDATEGASFIPFLHTWVRDEWDGMNVEEWESHGRDAKEVKEQQSRQRASDAASRASEERIAERAWEEQARQEASEAVERAKGIYRALSPEERHAAVELVRERWPMVTIPDPLPDEPTANLARAVMRVTATTPSPAGS